MGECGKKVGKMVDPKLKVEDRVIWTRHIPNAHGYVELLRATVVKLSRTKVCIRVEIPDSATVRRWVKPESLRRRKR